MRSRLTQLLALLFAFALVSAACGSDSETDASASEGTTAGSEGEAASGDLDCSIANLPLTEAGKLTIATGEPAYEPWMVDDDPANKKGFEGAVAYAIAEKMGFADADVIWTRSDFDAAIAPGEKPYDFNMQQYSITADRDEVVDFSEPYYSGTKSVLTMEGSPAASATNFEELKNAKWGATIGTTDLNYIENTMGIKDVAVYDTQVDVVSAMLAGQIDATVVALPTALYLSAVEVEGSVIAGVLPTDPNQADGDQMGLLFTEGSELRPCVNVAIEALTADGTLDALAVEWLQGEGTIPEIAAS